ncbi:tyrosine-type recombinase/integrase [Phytohabitans rumicis]|uniref:Integrase n=1 Tax=Phytohabitans rumicis TaxID=1076125 RepID=A0A6V8L5T4_9ACTN|nr:tyrosine-type recombinase/integrase [Phytohabitans rumicis]GFJ91594.1 integrase [Phytohabitans rumicis]
MTDPLLIQYLDWLHDCRRRPRTIEGRRAVLTRMDSELPYGLPLATTDELKAWIYRDEFCRNTLATYYGAARAFFVWATNPADPHLDFDPSALLPQVTHARGLPRPVTDDQLTHVLTHAAEPYRTWSLLAAYGGLRCCEIADLHREHVTAEELTIVDGKGGKPGVVPTHELVWQAVADLPPGPIAWTDKGTPASATYVSLTYALYLRRQLHMPGVGLHRLRHWYGTTVYQQTRDIRRTQELLRHSSLTSTQVYTLVTDEERQAAIQALPNLTGA